MEKVKGKEAEHIRQIFSYFKVYLGFAPTRILIFRDSGQLSLIKWALTFDFTVL